MPILDTRRERRRRFVSLRWFVSYKLYVHSARAGKCDARGWESAQLAEQGNGITDSFRKLQLLYMYVVYM